MTTTAIDASIPAVHFEPLKTGVFVSERASHSKTREFHSYTMIALRNVRDQKGFFKTAINITAAVMGFFADIVRGIGYRLHIFNGIPFWKSRAIEFVEMRESEANKICDKIRGDFQHVVNLMSSHIEVGLEKNSTQFEVGLNNTSTHFYNDRMKSAIAALVKCVETVPARYSIRLIETIIKDVDDLAGNQAHALHGGDIISLRTLMLNGVKNKYGSVWVRGLISEMMDQKIGEIIKAKAIEELGNRLTINPRSPEALPQFNTASKQLETIGLIPQGESTKPLFGNAGSRIAERFSNAVAEDLQNLNYDQLQEAKPELLAQEDLLKSLGASQIDVSHAVKEAEDAITKSMPLVTEEPTPAEVVGVESEQDKIDKELAQLRQAEQSLLQFKDLKQTAEKNAAEVTSLGCSITEKETELNGLKEPDPLLIPETKISWKERDRIAEIQKKLDESSSSFEEYSRFLKERAVVLQQEIADLQPKLQEAKLQAELSADALNTYIDVHPLSGDFQKTLENVQTQIAKLSKNLAPAEDQHLPRRWEFRKPAVIFGSFLAVGILGVSFYHFREKIGF